MLEVQDFSRLREKERERESQGNFQNSDQSLLCKIQRKIFSNFNQSFLCKIENQNSMLTLNRDSLKQRKRERESEK